MAGINPVRVALGGIGGAGFNSLAAGNKHYGTGRNAPNIGATPAMTGYAKRDTRAANRLDAVQRRLKGGTF